MMSYTKAKLDRLVEKMISRKFMVWLTATGLMAFSTLTSGDWVMISAIYIGGQTVIDGIAKMKGVG
jgi:urocanate hydratase